MSVTGTILVVDDDEAIRELLVLTLEDAGHRVVAAADGNAALACLEREPIDAILLDRTMPGMDGIDVLRAIRARPETALLPVILVTGLDQPTARVEGLEIGADDYVVKPFEPDEVVARVLAHLRGQRAWIDRLTAAIDQRRSILGVAAQRAATAETAADAAAVLCQEFVRMPDIGGAVIVEVAGGRSSVLGESGADGLRLLGLAEETATLDLVRSGRLEHPALLTTGAHTVVATPIATHDEMLGCLVLTGRNSLESDPLLALAIDFAALSVGVLGERLRVSQRRNEARQRLRDIIRAGTFEPVFQAVVELGTDRVVGYEALTRFHGDVDTEHLFVEAARHGLGAELEEATLRSAVAAAGAMPDGAWLAVNVTPSMILRTERLTEIFAGHDRDAVVLEISELEPVRDYDALLAAVDRIGVAVQLSVDDAGSGFASLAHILALGADFVKLDKTWIDGIDLDPAKRALVSGLQSFATETGAHLIAEGVETAAQLETIRDLGISYAQGFLLARPTAF